MKDTDWVFGVYRGQERLRDENGIKAHPTQKPLKLIQQVLLSASNKGDLVFDPFMGSGTTAVAAKKLGEKNIGIDTNEKYVKISERRIKELDEKANLFKTGKAERKNLQMELQVI
ncbi:MAG: modification methylase [Candidatus Berkelbacteria bacterium Licking1014_7]|uniref:Modification methylase n=1 Tax=Candidatus Berkelbacteria bacterium Licking1014_7 TaxID=2017147 RepID=A0A554LK15_9BACT|nr:MAG: modification methylase [Candidatus Berkelbacteria bacterium Licking1014_7]